MMKGKEPPSIVKSVMAKPVITVDSEGSIREVAKMMSERGVGCIVATKKGKPIGIATERDIIRRVVAKGLDASKARMKDVMSQPLITVDKDAPIISAIRVMEKNNVRHLLVKEKEELVGIVTQRDLLRVLAFHVLISFRPLL